MKQTLRNIVLGVTLASALLNGCSKPPREVEQNPIRANGTVIEDVLYRATLTDRNGDGLNDALKIERKFPTSYGSIEPMVEYFVTSLPRTLFPPTGEVVNLVKPDFFNQYKQLFDPNRDSITSTYRGQ